MPPIPPMPPPPGGIPAPPWFFFGTSATMASVVIRSAATEAASEVGRDVAAVELHAFDDFKLGLERLGFLDRDDALVADLLHGVGEELANFGVAVGGDGADLRFPRSR